MELKIKQCFHCNQKFETQRPKQKTCGASICVRKYQQSKYAERLKEKKCTGCDKIILATTKQKKCEDCRRRIKQNRNLSFVKIEVFCRKCHYKIKTETKKYIGQKLKKFSALICNQCKIKANQTRSESKRGKNNPNWKGKARKKTIRKLENLKPNNKKKGPKIERRCIDCSCILEKRAKRCINCRKKVKIERKYGSENPKWKGNREHDKIIRTRLAEWRKSHLFNANFTCKSCGQKGGELEVHHESEPLRDIYLRFTEKPLREYDKNSEEFENLIRIIISYHNDHVKGTVYCKECHGKHDSKRRIKNKKYKEKTLYGENL